jgi:hypothetical protein
VWRTCINLSSTASFFYRFIALKTKLQNSTSEQVPMSGPRSVLALNCKKHNDNTVRQDDTACGVSNCSFSSVTAAASLGNWTSTRTRPTRNVIHQLLALNFTVQLLGAGGTIIRIKVCIYTYPPPRYLHLAVVVGLA